MQKDRDIEAQSFVTIVLMCLGYIIADALFNLEIEFTELLIIFIAIRVMAIEHRIFK